MHFRSGIDGSIVYNYYVCNVSRVARTLRPHGFTVPMGNPHRGGKGRYLYANQVCQSAFSYGEPPSRGDAFVSCMPIRYANQLAIAGQRALFVICMPIRYANQLYLYTKPALDIPFALV